MHGTMIDALLHCRISFNKSRKNLIVLLKEVVVHLCQVGILVICSTFSYHIYLCQGGYRTLFCLSVSRITRKVVDKFL